MGGIIIACCIGAGLPMATADQPALKRYQFSQMEMAAPIKIVLYSPDHVTATRASQAAFSRIRQLNGILSDYDPESEVRRLCDTSREGGPVAVSDDLWHVIKHAHDLCDRSGGAFDVTISPVVRLWRRARLRRELPSEERISRARALVGNHLLRLSEERKMVELRKPDMRLDFGGIGKGYAGDEVLALLRREFGIRHAMVDAGGDLVLGDAPPDAKGWRIGIAPLEANGPPSRILTVSNVAIATSGDTWQYVEIEGVRYSHIVDPRTGIGLTDHSNVTIVAPTGIEADSLASAVSVLGPKRGLELIERTAGAEALIFRAPEGKIEIHESRGFPR